MNRITEAEQLLTILFGRIAALPFNPPKVHQHTRACERRVRQRTRREAKQALKSDKRLQIARI